MPLADRIIGYEDLAAITGKSPRTLRRWFKLERLHRVKFEGVVGVWESELIAALEWRGSGSLVIDDPDSADRDGSDRFYDLPNDTDAGLT